MTMPNARINWPRSIQQPLLAPEGDGGAAGEQKPGEQKPGEQQKPAEGEQQPKPGEAGKAGEQKPSEEQKPGEQKPGEQKPGEQKPAEGAPAKYELALPKDGLVDATDVARIEELARENNLPNDIAQSMLETTNAYLAQQADTWTKELEADKTYGGDKLAATQQSVNAALDLIAPKGTPRGDGLRRLLARGVGNNLDVVAALATVGRMTKEDLPVAGAAGGGEAKKKSPEEVLYPDSPEFKK